MKRAKKTFFIFIAILILLIFFHSLGWTGPIENLIKKGFLPIQAGIYKTSNWFGKRESEKVEALEKEIRELLMENARLQMLEEENKILREELNFLQKEGPNYVLANIIGAPSDKIYSSFILDKGASHGVHEGLAVVSHGELVGKIVKCDRHTSQVLTLLDSQSRAAALVLKKEEPFEQRTGLVYGRHGLSMEIELSSSEVEVVPGDLVLTSGLEENIPRGLVIGEIVEVEPATSAFFQKAQIRPLVDFNRLSIVSVILPDSY